MDKLQLPGLRVGVDICSVPRIVDAYHRFGDKFLRRVLTDSEIDYVKSSEKHLIVRVAGRFAAKEAIVKVLGTGWIGVGWHDVEIRRLASGEPRVALHGRAVARAEQLGLTHFEVSMSHEKEYAVAFVVAY
jgi:holo-[acyl-carrier protein] synthase